MKTIFITGASSGIGKATARFFQEKGWQVAAAVRKPESLADLAVLPGIKVYRLDVTDPASISAAAAQAIADFGTIDVLLNNAGYAAVGAFELVSEESVRRQMETNVFGLMNVTRAFLPHFRQRRSGTVINVSSVGGQITFPLYSLYHTSKWAVDGFSESLHYELRPLGIRVRVIEPGAIKTDFYTRSMEVASNPAITDYDDYTARVIPVTEALTADAPGPEIVAKRIWQAAMHRGGKLRFMVGKEGAFVLLKRWIPNTWFFALVRATLKA